MEYPNTQDPFGKVGGGRLQAKLAGYTVTRRSGIENPSVQKASKKIPYEVLIYKAFSFLPCVSFAHAHASLFHQTSFTNTCPKTKLRISE